jgi:CheY-like chemotaxis protein
MTTGNPAILVVEDEPLLRLMAVEIVQDAGFEALAATTADEALAILEARADDVRLVFTDIQMPGSMDGLGLAHAVRDRWPPVELIVTSGRWHVGANDLPARGRFIPKPYDVRVLSQVFQEMARANG